MRTPGLGVDAEAPSQRRRVTGGGRPKHSVTRGEHDGVLIAMAQQGECVAVIAARLDCSADLVARRLTVLGEAVRV